MNTTTTMILAPGEKLLRNDLDENKRPYIVCQVEINNGKKKLDRLLFPRVGMNGIMKNVCNTTKRRLTLNAPS